MISQVTFHLMEDYESLKANSFSLEKIQYRNHRKDTAQNSLATSQAVHVCLCMYVKVLM